MGISVKIQREINNRVIHITTKQQNMQAGISVGLAPHRIAVSLQKLKKQIQRSTFVGSAWSLGFFIHVTTANDLRLRMIFYPRFYPFFSILILQKESVFHSYQYRGFTTMITMCWHNNGICIKVQRYSVVIKILQVYCVHKQCRNQLQCQCSSFGL